MDDPEDNFSFLESEPSLLDMSSSYYKKVSKEKAKTKFIYLSVFLGVVTILEYFTRDYLKTFSNYLFHSNDPSRCYKYNYVEFYSFSGKYFILFLIYNYVNIFAALNLIFLDTFGLALNGIIRYFYLEPRPFWENEDSFPCFCATDYSGPSTTGTNIMIIFASLYRSFTYKNKNSYQRNFLAFVCTFCVIGIYYIRLAQNVDYLHQILFGCALGFGIHYWYYYIIKVNFYNRKQFRQIINQPIIMTTLIISVWLVINMIHFNTNFRTKPIYVLNIQKYCVINTVFSFDKETFTKSILIFEFFGSYLGVLMEYRITFGGKIDLFAKYNIKSKHKEMFNHTSGAVSFVRFLLFYFVQVLIFKRIIYNKVSAINYEQSTLFVLVFLLFIPLVIQGIFFFYFMKRIVVWLGLTNESLFKVQQQDSLPQSKIDDID